MSADDEPRPLLGGPIHVPPLVGALSPEVLAAVESWRASPVTSLVVAWLMPEVAVVMDGLAHHALHGPPHDCDREGCYGPPAPTPARRDDEPDRLRNVMRAVAEIEFQATHDSVLQPGAAYALGALSEVAGAGPGWSSEELARAIASMPTSALVSRAEADPELVAALRQLGDRFGPLGVARTAAGLTDPAVLVKLLTGQARTGGEPRETP